MGAFSTSPARASASGVAARSLTLLWLALFLVLPFLILLKISVSDQDETGTRFLPLLTLSGEQTLSLQLHLGAYWALISDSFYLRAYLSSLGYAALTTLLCLLIGYPFAMVLARAQPAQRLTLLLLLMLPFWTSFLLRVYAFKAILDANGLVNRALLALGLIHEPLTLLYTPFSFMAGMVYVYLPFMILPLTATLVKLDRRYNEAAADLGARPWANFFLVTLPLSRSGILAGTMLVFIPSVGEYVIPDLLAGPAVLNIGRVLWNELFLSNDWMRACAIAIVLILAILPPILLFERTPPGSRSAAAQH